MTDGPSVVVPVRNEAAAIRRLLESLHRQTLPPTEVIVVDGGSRDDTVRTALGWGDRLPLRVVKAGPAFPGRARNLGIEAARSEWIALVDCGGHADARWLERLCSRAEAEHAEVAWGQYEPLVGSRPQRWVSAVIMPGLMQHRNGRWRGRSTASCLISRQAWRKVGGFPEDLRSGEDLVFFRRLEAEAVKEAVEPAARVFWRPPRGFRAMLARNRLYSASGLRAGLWREWQLGVVRSWALTAALVLLGLLDWRILGLVPVLMGARIARIFVRHRRDSFLALARTPTEWFGVAAALLVSDLATVCGTWDWLMDTYLRRARHEGVHALER